MQFHVTFRLLSMNKKSYNSYNLWPYKKVYSAKTNEKKTWLFRKKLINKIQKSAEQKTSINNQGSKIIFNYYAFVGRRQFVSSDELQLF